MKLNKYIIILSSLAILSSCQFIPKKNNQSQDEENKSTIIKSYYEKSGALKSEITVLNKKKNGPAKKYYPTGELHTLVNYVNNAKQGETIWYYKNGQPYRITPYVNGKMEGIRKTYYETGKIQAEIPYKEGELIEGTKEYDSSGQLISDNTRIVFETVDLIKYENNYVLKMKLSKSARNVEFFEEKESTAGTKIMSPIAVNRSGIGEIKYYMPPGSFEMSVLKIYAKYKTRLGNPVLISTSYNLNIENK